MNLIKSKSDNYTFTVHLQYLHRKKVSKNGAVNVVNVFLSNFKKMVLDNQCVKIDIYSIYNIYSVWIYIPSH